MHGDANADAETDAGANTDAFLILMLMLGGVDPFSMRARDRGASCACRNNHLSCHGIPPLRRGLMKAAPPPRKACARQGKGGGWG
eukprot:2983887-Pleurochrysis_carterae.AAC.1